MLIETRSRIVLNGVIAVALAALLLRPPPLGAQGLIERVVIKGGPSIAYAYHQIDSDGEAGHENTTILWNALVTHETARLAGPVAASLELGYVERGYSHLGGTFVDGEGSTFTQQERWRFLTFAPMAVVVHHRGTLRFHAQAGPRVSWLLSPIAEDDFGAFAYERVLLEATAGIGVQVPTGVVPVLLEARYNHALANFTSASIWKGRTLRFRTVDLFVGFVL